MKIRVLFMMIIVYACLIIQDIVFLMLSVGIAYDLWLFNLYQIAFYSKYVLTILPVIYLYRQKRGSAELYPKEVTQSV